MSPQHAYNLQKLLGSLFRGKNTRIRAAHSNPADQKTLLRLSFGRLHAEVTLKNRVSKSRLPRKSRLSRKYASLVALSLQLLMLSGVLHYGAQVITNTKPLLPASAVSIPAPTTQPTLTAPRSSSARSTSLLRSRPTTLELSRLEISGEIIPVGLLQDGSLETPDVFSHDVGWFDEGVTPGEVGTAILTGHVDTINGPSVFARLNEVVPGDTIKIKRADGNFAVFRVTKTEAFEQNSFPSENVYKESSLPEIRLITCGGVFDESTQRYSHNTVVFARLEQPTQTF